MGTYAAPMTSTYAAPMVEQSFPTSASMIATPSQLPTSASMIATPSYLPTSGSMIATPSYGGYGAYSGASAMDGPFKFHATPQTQTVTQTMAAPTATVTRPVAQQPVKVVGTTQRKKKKSSKKKKKKGCCH